MNRTLLGLLLLAWSWQAAAQAVKLEAIPSHGVVLAGKPQKVYLKISLVGASPARREERAPINIALVLDRSGSMSGQKIQNARKAAIRVMDYLNRDDVFSVVAYSSEAQVLLPATKLHDKSSAREAIRSIRANGGTALHAGVVRGAGEVRKFLDPDRVNRVILLSDGLANVGPQTPRELADLGRELVQEGISVTTLGLGFGYNEDLMTQLAYASDGNHAFIKKPSQLAKVFEQEFGDVLSVVAQQVEIEIHCAEGVRPRRALGREARIQDQRIEARLNQLYANQEKYLLMELEVEPGRVGQSRTLAEIQTRYRDLGLDQPGHQTTRVTLRFGETQAEMNASEDRGVLVAVSEQIAVEENERAVKLRDEGKVREAEEVLRGNASFLKRKAKELAAPELAEQGQANDEAAESLDSENWGAQRKQMRKDQYRSRSRQSY